jgi:GNAT superfamily N-acetyltransferase
MSSRAATARDADRVTETVRLGFASDPVWGPALRSSNGEAIDLDAYWRLFVEGALRFGTLRLATDCAAISVWIPPGETELSASQLVELDRLIRRDLDPDALAALLELYERFETSRAGRPAHYYLSLLATHPDHRGQGRGQLLLAEDLALWDAMGVPAYLESTNSANDHRYVRAGFRPDGGFQATRDDTWISAMWRPVGGASE